MPQLLTDFGSASVRPGLERPRRTNCRSDQVVLHRRDPFDNAKAESFMKTLKTEGINGKAFADLSDARCRIDSFGRPVAFRLDALPTLRDAARAGMGLVLLPCYFGDTAAGLHRAVPKTLPKPRSSLWLLTHDDLKRTAHIRATMDFLATALASQRALLEGRQPGNGTSAKTRRGAR
jgi:DNA-binding transcriptional LysR family regulator